MRPRHDQEIAKLIATLKELLRGHGLTYRRVAEMLLVSERTVQRWLNGHGLTLDVLSQLSDLVDLGLADLLAMSQTSTDKRPRQLTEAQEQGLVDQPSVAFLFTRLLQGWSPFDFQRACGLSEVQLTRHLLTLERLKLLELHPGNRVRLLTRRDIDWHKGGPMRAYFDQFAKRLVASMRFGEEESIWTSEALHLSPGSAAIVEERLQALRLEIRLLAESERDLSEEAKSWYSLLLLAFRHDLTDPDDPIGFAFNRHAPA